MNSMMKILEDLTPLNRVICSTDYDKTIQYLLNILPFKVLEYPSSDIHNGWVIPPKWDVKEASIRRDGEIIYDGTHHSLAVIAYSEPFRGMVDHTELRKHLHYDHRYDDALPFHFRQQFRSWKRDWGFCVPKTFYDSLDKGEYDVVIETDESQGVLRMLEITHKGTVDETIVFFANLDHPGVANDGLSGVVVGIELFRRLAAKQTKFSYRLVLAQGIIGSEYYLGRQSEMERSMITECVCLWMLGSRTSLALQKSRCAFSNAKYVITQIMNDLGILFRQGEFGSIIINDEYIWEAYGIPTCSLSRMPYPEYHSSKDSLDIISEECLEEAVAVLEGTINILDKTSLVYKKFKGNICLSNPIYDLYIDPGQVAFGNSVSEKSKRMRLLMDIIPSLSRPITTRELAELVSLPEENVLEYLQKWKAKQLVDLR